MADRADQAGINDCGALDFACPGCSYALVPPPPTELTQITLCPHCDVVFDVRHQLSPRQRKVFGYAPIPPPSAVKVQHRERDADPQAGLYRQQARQWDHVWIAVLWRKRPWAPYMLNAWRFGFKALCVVFVAVGVLSWISDGLGDLAKATAWLAFVTVIGYLVAAALLNRTCVQVDDEAVSVCYGPLPWRKGTRLPARHIARISAREFVATIIQSTPVIEYEVIAELDCGDQHVLVDSLKQPDVAVYVAETLTSALGLEHRPSPNATLR